MITPEQADTEEISELEKELCAADADARKACRDITDLTCVHAREISILLKAQGIGCVIRESQKELLPGISYLELESVKEMPPRIKPCNDDRRLQHAREQYEMAASEMKTHFENLRKDYNSAYSAMLSKTIHQCIYTAKTPHLALFYVKSPGHEKMRVYPASFEMQCIEPPSESRHSKAGWYQRWMMRRTGRKHFRSVYLVENSSRLVKGYDAMMHAFEQLTCEYDRKHPWIRMQRPQMLRRIQEVSASSHQISYRN
jgi:hypothetical protein